MNKFLTKVTALCVGLAMVAGVGVAVGSRVSEAKAADVSDTITASDLAASTTTYVDFSGVSGTSGAVYAGNSAKSSAGAIQMRSKNSNSGIVSTASGGTVKSVTITVQSGSNTIDVYGSNTAYTSASQLYSSVVGTKVGSTSSTGTITFTDSYSYVGIRSNNGAIYLTSIEVVWDDGEGGGGGGHVHTPGTAVQENLVEPTCTEAGSYDSVVYCTECEEEISRTPTAIPATGHNFVDHVCTVCGAEEPDETTITKTMSEVVSENSFTVSAGTNVTCYTEFNLDSSITVSTSGSANCGSFWGSSPNNEWRLYQNKSGDITITASTGYELSSITITFSVTNTGALFDGSSQVSSGTAQTVSGSSKTYTVGNSGSATNGQVRITAISVTYSSSGGGTSDTYSVSYNANGSSSRPVENMPPNVNGLEDGETCTLSGSPTRWGYTFLGWGISASATATISSVTIDGANETVYALWQEDHTVAGAWSDSPYTVAQARTAIDDNEHLTDVYVAGTISQVDSYNSTYKSITYWISDDGSTTNQFEVYSGKGLNGADFSAVGDVEVGAQVVVNGDIKLYSSTYEFDKNNKQIVYEAPSTGDIEVTFQPSIFLGVGDSGTYTASTEAANPNFSFSSDNSSVLSVTSGGAYTAVAAGSATVRVDVTSSDGNGYKEVAVTVVEVKTVSEAYEIAAALSSGATTDYSIKVTGAISSLDADGKARAINITDGTQVIEVFFGGGNADYTTVSTTGLIGSKVTVFAKVQNYSGTYELKDITLAGVAAADADSFAAGAYKSLDGSCETGPEAVTEAQWTAASNGYAELSSAEQAKFSESDVTPYGENVVNWVDRYERIVSGSTLTNFMNLTSIAGRLPYEFSEITDVNNSVAIIIIVAVTSMTLLGVTLVLRKRKHQ